MRTLQGEEHPCEDFKYSFEADKFLNPEIIERHLESYQNPLEKLQFLYDCLYANSHKNRCTLNSRGNHNLHNGTHLTHSTNAGQ